MNEEENKSVEAVENAVEQGKEAARAENEKTDDGVIRVDLRNFKEEQEDAVPEQETDAGDAVVGESEDEASSEAVVEEVQEPSETEEPVQAEEQPVLEEITEEEVQEQAEDLADEVEEAIAEQQESGVELPENIQKVVDFMNDTGGTLEDYVRLNQDYSQVNEAQLLREYYETTKPHLDREDIDLLMEDFAYDEELDDEKEVRKAKLAFKEEVAKAKNHLETQKSKYYEEIKAGSRLTPEQQKAVEFFNRYNKENEETTRIAEKQKKTFLKRTDEVFSNEFKGFEYNVGDKKYRFNVKDASQVKNAQSDINNFVKKFLDENNNMKDAKGYHKSLFTAMNADAIANHFYEQGKADALKESIARSKNVNMDPRKSHEPVTDAKGFKVRAISGDDTSRLKVKIRK